MYRSPKTGTPFPGRSGLASDYYFGRLLPPPPYALPTLVFTKIPPVYPYTIVLRWMPVSRLTWLSGYGCSQFCVLRSKSTMRGKCTVPILELRLGSE